MNPEALTKSRVLVDTNVFSYIFWKRTQANFFLPYLAHKTLAVSFITVGELYYGAYKADWGQKRIEELESKLKNYVVIPYDYGLCQTYARIRTDREKLGLSVDLPDVWIAACAVNHDCALATNNGRHFEGIPGLDLISPTTLQP